MTNAPVKGLASKHHLLWQGNTTAHLGTGLSTGFPVLDPVLPGHGWPNNGLIEIVVPYWGIGELRLLLPAMIDLNRRGRRIAWVTPPYLPYAPALARAGLELQYVLVVDAQSSDVCWAMERLLHAESTGMVLAWPQRLSDLETRRLQLAAESGGSIGVVLHTGSTKWRAASAALRLSVQPQSGSMAIDIVKARGACRRSRIRIKL